MSRSVMDQFIEVCFQIQGHHVTGMREEGSKVILEMRGESSSVCPICGGRSSRYDSRLQEIYVGSLLGRGVYARVKVYRVDCRKCGIHRELARISEGKRRYSKAVGQDLIRYTALLDNAGVATLLGISASMVYRIDREELGRLMERYDPGHAFPTGLSVDEVSYKRRHKYATMMSDYGSGRVLWMEKGRAYADLVRGYTRLGEGRNSVETVALDFWPAYEKATREQIPKAHIVFDRFHLTRILNRKVEDERRAYQKDLSQDQRRTLKRECRWLMLKRKGNLSESNQERLSALKTENEPLYTLYLLKEDFLDIFQPQRPREEAHSLLRSWIRLTQTLPYPSMKRFARTLLKRLSTLLNWFDHPISNGKAEGINNVVKTLLKRAYGYKDFPYFRMKVLQKCGLLMDLSTHTF